jgi:hypothetical protein
LLERNFKIIWIIDAQPQAELLVNPRVILGLEERFDDLAGPESSFTAVVKRTPDDRSQPRASTIRCKKDPTGCPVSSDPLR